MSHPGSRLIHAAPGSRLPGEITSHFNRTYVSNSLHNLILTHAHAHTLKNPSDSYLHIFTFVFGVKRHLTSLSFTHIQRRAEGENERGKWCGGVFSLQLISHHFPTSSISSPLRPLFYIICSFPPASLNGLPASRLKHRHDFSSLLPSKFHRELDVVLLEAGVSGSVVIWGKDGLDAALNSHKQNKSHRNTQVQFT